MNKMILTAVLVVSTLFMSCSNDDDDSTQDTIIGKWQLEQRFENDVEESLSDDCEKKSTMEFKTDDTFIDIESFFEPGQPCISSTDPGTWEYNGDNALKISYDGDSEVIEITYTFVNGKLNLVIENIKTIWKKIN